MDKHGWSTTPQMGQIIFSADSKKKNDEFWDDQELIDHWEATKEIYKKHHSKLKKEDSPPPFSTNKKYNNEMHQKKRKLTSNQKSPKKRKSNQTRDDFIYTHIPPAPPAPTPTPAPPSFSIPYSYQCHTDASISQLIHAWYLYGYYNGYQAGQSLNHQVKSNKNENKDR